MTSHMQHFELDVLSAVANSKRVWLIHLVANALLLIAFFYWTQIPEENGWQFALTVVSGLLIALMTLWLHCATFDYFRPAPERRFRESLRRAAGHLPAFLVWALMFGFGLWSIGHLWNYDEQLGGWARHSLPSFLRREITPRSIISVSHWLAWFLCFILWPILLLPVGGQVAAKGFRGLYSRAGFRPLRHIRFWIVYLVCFGIGAYLPYALAWMTPTKAASLSAQTWSMGLRLGSAYLLLVTGWVALCAAIMRACSGEDEVVSEVRSEALGAAPAS